MKVGKRCTCSKMLSKPKCTCGPLPSRCERVTPTMLSHAATQWWGDNLDALRTHYGAWPPPLSVKRGLGGLTGPMRL